MVQQDGSSLTSYNEINESMVFENTIIRYPFEYSKNKMLVTGHPSQMFLVIEWSIVKVIPDTNNSNINKNYAFLMPGFDENSFPFIAVCGKNHIRIVNIATLEHQKLISGEMRTDKPGLRFAFAKGD